MCDAALRKPNLRGARADSPDRTTPADSLIVSLLHFVADLVATVERPVSQYGWLARRLVPFEGG